MEGDFEMSQWRSVRNICGWLSLLCWIPYLTLLLAQRWLHNYPDYPDWMFPVVLGMIYLGPVVGTPLALVAATTRRWWWIVLAVVSLVVLGYVLWWDAHHPFYI
jgi:hypothetical protein